MTGGWLKAFISNSWILTTFPALSFPAGLCFLPERLLGLLLQKRAVHAALLSRHLRATKKVKGSLLVSCYSNKANRQRYWKCHTGDTWRAIVAKHLPCLCAAPLIDIRMLGLPGHLLESSNQRWHIQLMNGHP